jgi:hypothetical protein
VWVDSVWLFFLSTLDQNPPSGTWAFLSARGWEGELFPHLCVVWDT